MSTSVKIKTMFMPDTHIVRHYASYDAKMVEQMQREFEKVMRIAKLNDFLSLLGVRSASKVHRTVVFDSMGDFFDGGSTTGKTVK